MSQNLAKAPIAGNVKWTAGSIKANSKPVEIDSSVLFENGNELFIRHDGERYTLRRTSRGKLILTK